MAKQELVKKKKTLPLVLFILVLLLVAGAWVVYAALFRPVIKTTEDYFFVKTGDNYGDVLQRIQEEGVVKSFDLFKLVAQAMEFEKTGPKPGRYKLDSLMSNRQLVRNLLSGRQEAVSFRFQNIRLKEDFAGLLGRSFEADSLEFITMLKDTVVSEKYGFTPDSFFGMFIPNTYQIYWNTDTKNIFERFHKEYEIFWSEDRKAKAAKLGLSPQQVSTLASIVKGEALHVDEMPKIAGLYLNRLNKGMLLQADPTVIFAANDFTIRRVLNKHLIIDSPYNTYRYRGLPPGPIMMPSIASIDAVLNHSDHNYLYMCAKDDFSGYHLFAKTMEEHLVNARKFQRALDLRNIKK